MELVCLFLISEPKTLMVSLSYNFPRDVSSSSYKVEALPKCYTSVRDLHMSSKSKYSAPLSNVINPDFDYKIMDSPLSEEKRFSIPLKVTNMVSHLIMHHLSALQLKIQTSQLYFL